VLDADGTTRWGPFVPVTAGTLSVTGRVPGGSAIGLSVQAGGTVPAYRAVIGIEDRAYELGGALSTAVTPGPWRLTGTSQGYAVFTSAKAPVPISARTTGGRPLRVRVVANNTKSETVRVDAPAPAAIIRSVAWDPGWKGSVSVNGAAPRSVPVDSYDLVQRVQIPAGHDVVTFSYRPPHLVVASVLSLGAVGVLLALLGGWLVVRWRRRPDPAVTTPEARLRKEQPVPV
jgi:hypothetical protein